MSDRQYTVARQNLRDDTNSLFGLSKEYQKEYDEKMLRFKNDESQVLESMLMENIEGLANLSNAGTFINMESGQVSIGTYKGKGDERKLSNSPEHHMTVNQMRNRYKQQYDKFDLSGTMTLEAERTAQYTTALRTAGGENYVGTIESLLDPTKRGYDADGALTDAISDFVKYEKEMINSYIGNEYQALSILTNSLKFDPDGNAYYPTLDPSLKGKVKDGKQYILVEDDGSGTITVDMTKDQKKAAFKTAQTNFRNKLDYKETKAVYTEPKKTDTSKQNNKIEAAEDEIVSSWNTLYYGTNEQKKTAITNLLNSKIAKGKRNDGSDSILAIDITKNGEIEVSYKDPTLNQVISYDPNNIKLEDWARLGNFIHGVDDIETVMGRAGGTLSGTDGARRLGVGYIDNVFANRQGQSTTESQGDAFKRILEKKFDTTTEAAIKSTAVTDKDDANDNFVVKFTDSMPAGFNLETRNNTGATRGQVVRVKYKTPKGVTVYSEDINITGGNSMQMLRDFITKQSGTEESMVQQALYIKNNGGKVSGAQTYITRLDRKGVGSAYNPK